MFFIIGFAVDQWHQRFDQVLHAFGERVADGTAIARDIGAEGGDRTAFGPVAQVALGQVTLEQFRDGFSRSPVFDVGFERAADRL